MAAKQIDNDTETLEEALARANAQTEAARLEAARGIKYPCPVCKYTGPIKTDLNSPTALKGLAIEVLVQIIETAPRNVSLVAAIRELIDRVEGKAPQSVTMDLTDRRMDKLPIDKLLRLASMLDDPIVILPPIEKLGDY